MTMPTSNSSFHPTSGQQQALDQLKVFISSPHVHVFLLKGYAGTGKTTLVKEIIRLLSAKGLPITLMASTGRAAKILSNATGRVAATVHATIYRYTDFNQDLNTIAKQREQSGIDKSGQLVLLFEATKVPNDGKTRYYIVDEASMVGDKEEKNATQASFGTGRLLKDLLDYDPNGKFIFVGDACQLPPVLDNASPALTETYFQKQFRYEVLLYELTEIVRTSKDNDMVIASHKIRQLYADPPLIKWGKFPLRGHKNIQIFPDQTAMLNDYVKRLKTEGYNNATLICRSNRACLALTNLIRPALGLEQPKMQVGDLLLITQNNMVSGLMNGDLVEVVSIGSVRRRAYLSFIHVEVKELFSQKLYSQLLIEEILYTDYTNLTQEQQKELFLDYYLRMRAKGIKQDSPEFRDGLRTDMYLNALRAVFGFALTCHKAQGGEWEHVYVDIPRNFPLNPSSETYQWLYTAITRAKSQLYLADGFWLV